MKFRGAELKQTHIATRRPPHSPSATALLAIPAAIVIFWWIQLNRRVRRDLRDEIKDEGGDSPIA